MRIGTSAFAAIIFAASALPAHAALTVSKKATANVTCDAGTCTSTARTANLNATELSAMLADGDVVLKSSKQSKDIEIRDAVTWASAHKLTFDANHSISIAAVISVEGTSGLTLTTNDKGTGGTLSFPSKGYVTFWDRNSVLVINSRQYILADSIDLLVAIAVSIPEANVALTKSFDLAGMALSGPLIPTAVFGKIEGLGNTISNLQIKSTGQAGLYSAMFGWLENLHLTKVKISGTNQVGALAAACGGVISNVDASGHVTGKSGASTGGLCGTGPSLLANAHFSGSVSGSGNASGATRSVGGLIGFGQGLVTNSYSTATVDGADGWQVGGLIGHSENSVSASFATGTVRGTDSSIVGGLIGQSSANGEDQLITNVYATGFTGGGVNSTVGGLIGQNNGPVSDSYASGPVVSGSGNAVGGLIGNDLGNADLTDTYFDIDTTGQSHGVGNNTGYPGVTGLTTEQFQAGLPTGFDPLIWAENANINGGLPYLLALPPG